MLLNTVKAKNAQGSVLELPLEDPTNGFVVRNISGLAPVKATLVSTSFANQDGEQYHSSRREARNIVLTLGLEPDYAIQGVQTLRDQLYAYFMPKSETTLVFGLFDKFTENLIDQTREKNIVGRIESFESELFTDDPTADISIMCFDPDFFEEDPVIFNGMTVNDTTNDTISYEGTVPTGVLFTLSPDRDLPEFTIYHQGADQILRTVDFSYPLAASDSLAINSVQGSKYITLTHLGVASSVLYGLSPQSGWLELQPGENLIRVYAEGAPIPFSLQYIKKYGGL